MANRVITGFTHHKDAALDFAAAEALTGLKGNSNFSFTGTSFTDFATAANAFHACMGALATGGKIAVAEKNEARKTLTMLFSAVAAAVNLQAAGNLEILQTTGIRLAKHKQHHQQPLPVNLKVGYGNNGAMLVSVSRSPVGDRGTVFAFTPVTNTATNPNTWMLHPSNGHKAVISGLPPGAEYFFTAAYKGRDKDALVWAPPVRKFVGN
jgi:hypothetical protein